MVRDKLPIGTSPLSNRWTRNRTGYPFAPPRNVQISVAAGSKDKRVSGYGLC